MTEPLKTHPVYFAGLNGLRAIAALTVVFGHITRGLDEFHLDRMILGSDANGNPYGSLQSGIAVTIFFCLSGFLITSLLLEEKKTQISIKNFYIRRILRIWPLYFLYIGLVLLVMNHFNDRIVFTNLLWYLLMGANFPRILGGSIMLLQHYWSIGVEEQFYAFWPWIVKKVGLKRMLLVFALLFLLIFGLKVYFRWINIQYNIALPFQFFNMLRFDIMIIGGMGALLYFMKHELFLRIATHAVTQTIAWGIMVLFMFNLHFGITLNHEIAGACTLAIIIAQAERKNRIFNLENKVCDFLGKISYGIYVYHPLVIFSMAWLLHRFTLSNGVKYALVYAGIFAVTIFTAYVSYEYFEKKFLKLKDRFSTVFSSSVKTGQNT
jgi:peptidoglycan/LPS O-acetylase OafA/YrhL